MAQPATFITPLIHTLRRLPALWFGALILTACTTVTPPPASTAPSQPVAHTTGNNDSISSADLAETELASLQAQLDGMQEQINALRHQQHALTQLVSNRGHVLTTTASHTGSAGAPSRLAQARQLYQAGLYTQAVRLLKGADSGGNGGLDARQSMFLLMQSHWHLNNCESVINIGNRFANRFANSPQAPDALYLVGQCQARLQQKDMARTTWRKITGQYPNSAAAKRAGKLLNGH